MSEIIEGAQNRALTPEFLHDLRTPLNHIIGFSELLADQAREESQLAFIGDLEKIHAAGLQLLSLLNDGVAPAPPTSASDSRFNGVTPPAGAYSHILVVDDNEMNREVLSRRLEQLGYAVATAENGIVAMVAARSRTPDLVLLDIMMPEMDGYEVLKALKGDERLKHLPVIMISAVDEVESVARCIEMGAEDYLAKPFNPILLKARVGASLDRKRAHDREMRLYEQSQEQYLHLQELEKLRDNLTHMIIHDLRTPLTSVISGLQSVAAMGSLNPGQLEVLDISVAGGETLLEMINSLLDVDKMESGSMELDYTLLDADQLVSSAVAQVAQLAETGEISLVWKPGSGVPFFEGDEVTLRRTLVNLLGNAIKFTPAAGSVTVDVREQDKFLVFSVTDTGEGVPEEAFGRIFEKFGQVASRQNGRLMSTGLGLTFCKLAVEAHGGEISVANADGQGSTFSFTVPVKRIEY